MFHNIKSIIFIIVVHTSHNAVPMVSFHSYRHTHIFHTQIHTQIAYLSILAYVFTIFNIISLYSTYYYIHLYVPYIIMYMPQPETSERSIIARTFHVFRMIALCVRILFYTRQANKPARPANIINTYITLFSMYTYTNIFCIISLGQQRFSYRYVFVCLKWIVYTVIYKYVT